MIKGAILISDMSQNLILHQFIFDRLLTWKSSTFDSTNDII